MSARLKQEKAKVQAYENVHQYLADELKRLDLLLQRKVHLLKKHFKQSEEYVQSIPAYVSDDEAQWLLSQQGGWVDDDPTAQELEKQADEQASRIQSLAAESELQGLILPFIQLTRLFSLNWLEQQALLICLAPELRRKYDRIYAYLQDDITRKRPSVDLILEVLFDQEDDRWQARPFFERNANLFRHLLLRQLDDPSSPSGSSGLSRFLQLDERILHYLLGYQGFDARLEGYMRVYQPTIELSELNVAKDKDKTCLHKLLMKCLSSGENVRQQLIVNAFGAIAYHHRMLALSACKAIECPLLVLDLKSLSKSPVEFSLLIKLALRESLLLQAPLFIENADYIETLDQFASYSSTLQNLINEYGWIVILGTGQPLRYLEDSDVYAIECALPDIEQSRRLWDRYLDKIEIDDKENISAILAQRFKLSADQIEKTVRQAGLMREAEQADCLNFQALAQICRSQFRHKLGSLARKVSPNYQWDDLILPSETKEILSSICCQVEYQYRVFEQWGFVNKLAYGRGLSVLFSGSPGTGKTMAAQVLANQLQLDFYKIDLSSVVSKYIGETEKNLDRIFTEAEASNAILFFDEADALFGKRTEVSDAHDRYANIEVSFLLQKMEEYDGIVILATNLRSNMDDAFVRRIRFIIDFPFPDKESRLQIWQRSLPDKTPIEPDIDFEWLAAKVKIPGGSIKNIVLNAAFEAARENQNLGMEHMLQGCKSEFQKLGKLWDEKNMNYQPTDSGGGYV